MRELFSWEKNLDIYDTIFDDGESPLKESRGINLYGKACSNGSIRCGTARTLLRRIATGLRWREPESGTLIISR